jgi:aspartyl-tRNA(Asn)/glutamyl-tRNA(Gln) amidotransferase subunit B
MSWEAVIGLEVHARLSTASKLFCGCANVYDAPPNTLTCPVCLGYPGALPVLNGKAVDLALRAATAFECEVHGDSQFARKNYFYPDLPKGYQISQFDRPLATAGRLQIRTKSVEKNVRIQRIHLEEDAGKSLHQSPWTDVPAGVSLVDLNRAGTPLIEIVAEPDIRSAEEATAYLTRLRQILMYIGACDGNMEEGSLRCDANVSVRREGEPLGTRAEIKNLNSFRYLSRAVEFEIERQIALLESGQRVVQETRLFDAAAGETRSMRSKEEAHDYRYFPEPDLHLLRVEERVVEEIRSSIPALPSARIARYGAAWDIAPIDAETLVSTRELAEFFEATAALSAAPRSVANWVKNELIRVFNETGTDVTTTRISPAALASLVNMVEARTLSGKAAKELIDEISATGADPEVLVRERGLAQMSDSDSIRTAAQRVLDANQEQLAAYRAGKTKLFGFFVGQLMKETGGRADANVANQVMRELLDT